ncbi:MAG: putative transcriptional regulator, LysR family [Firmicutes bacterium]|nr:putative transcriptional regulator, LysR family [Bacillota bacterium]
MENLRYFRYIYTIYQEKSFSKAAQMLHISQPALSAIIKKWEKQLGYALFDRQTTPITPTEEGKAYLAAAEQMYRVQKELEIYIEDIRLLQTGHLTVAGTALYCSYVLPQIVSSYTALYPGIQLDFQEADSIRLYEELAKDKIDLIIDGGEPDENRFSIHPLFYEHILLAVPKTNPLNEKLVDKKLTRAEVSASDAGLEQKKGVDLSLFCNESFVLLKKEHDLHSRAMRLCRERGFTPKVSIHPNQLMTAYNVASQGLGCTLVTDTLVKRCSFDNELTYYNIAALSQELTSRQVFIAHKKNRYSTHAMRNFVALAHSIFK